MLAYMNIFICTYIYTFLYIICIHIQIYLYLYLYITCISICTSKYVNMHTCIYILNVYIYALQKHILIISDLIKQLLHIRWR
jgi:hypothetical protein